MADAPQKQLTLPPKYAKLFSSTKTMTGSSRQCESPTESRREVKAGGRKLLNWPSSCRLKEPD